ncbi:hypothetical protein HYY70_01285 [Candidatus Woesearchaeota archaeon]|nr:hypothetical protein [Candidatus Woesearchaeota archaeon]
MKTYFVVTAVVKVKDKVLILKKSAKDYNYPNKWSFCSGYVKEFESAEIQTNGVSAPAMSRNLSLRKIQF